MGSVPLVNTENSYLEAVGIVLKNLSFEGSFRGSVG